MYNLFTLINRVLGLHFGLTGLFQNMGLALGLTDEVGEYMSAFCGGSVAALFASPVELVMIQQQLHGGSMISVVQRVTKNHGMSIFARGLMPAMLRDAIYVSGFLGITPTLQSYLMRKHELSTMEAGLWASVVGGICAAVPSHPLDLVKVSPLLTYKYGTDILLLKIHCLDLHARRFV